jgi:hypothetical protein
MSCSRVQAELLGHFAFGGELGPRSLPHLEHLESCADCRREVGIDRALVMQLRGALRDRVEGGAPSEASWGLVRQRTVDRPSQPWTGRVQQWRSILSTATAAGVLVFAATTASRTAFSPGTQSPAFIASVASRAVPPVEETSRWPDRQVNRYDPALPVPPLPGWPMETGVVDQAANADEPPIPGRMR